jgi:hypothetical protein
MLTGQASYTEIVSNKSFGVKLYAAMGILMLFSLQFQTLPLDIKVQMMPLTTIIAVIAFPFVIKRIPKSPVLTIVLIFATYSVLHSIVMALIHLFSGEGIFRAMIWARQLSAFLLGIITFFVMRHTFMYMSTMTIAKSVMLSSFPAMILGVLNVLWGGFNQAWAGVIVTGVHEILSPYNYFSPLRATGLSTEPASFATTIALLVLPVVLILYRQKINRFVLVLFSFLTLASFLWTFSSTGIILLLCLFIAGIMFGPNKSLFVRSTIMTLVLTVAIVAVFPKNQVIRHVMAISAGNANVSYDDRFYSAFGPFIRIPNSTTLFGYGLGGIATHFGDVVPKEVEQGIRDAKYKGLPGLASAFGRTFAETGFIGFVFFLGMFAFSLWQLHILLKREEDESTQYAYKIVRLALLGVFAAIFIAIGPYYSPLLWFWIAFIDARYARVVVQQKPAVIQ